MIAIIDYDIGNIGSIVNMLRRLGLSCIVAKSEDDIEVASKIILPGNGSFDSCIKNLRNSGLIPVLERHVLQLGKPLLGICVGAQMLGFSSAEGNEGGLGWIDMRVERFPETLDLRIPHMGWNRVNLIQEEHKLVHCMPIEARFYFVHSYYMNPLNSSDVLLSANYGISFAAGVVHENIVGVQFHPEKSHRFGMQLISNFAKWEC